VNGLCPDRNSKNDVTGGGRNPSVVKRESAARGAIIGTGQGSGLNTSRVRREISLETSHGLRGGRHKEVYFESNGGGKSELRDKGKGIEVI